MIGGRASPAISAAARPTAPAFAVCVWRMWGRIRRISCSIRVTASGSYNGDTSRCIAGIGSTGTPISSATNAIESSPCASRPAARVVEYPRASSPFARYATLSAGPPMLRRAIARRIRMGSDKGLDRALQTLLEADRRLPAQHLARTAHVRPRVADVAGARRRGLLPHGLAQDRADRVGDLVDADR